MSNDKALTPADAFPLSFDPSLGFRFFENDERNWSIFATLIAVVLFIQWTFRSGLALELILLSCASYTIAALAVTQLGGQFLSITQDGELTHFLYLRSGISWRLMLNALLGMALCFLIAWFPFASNSMTDPALGQLVMLVAMLFTVLLLPITPLLASIPQLPIMKTRVEAVVVDGVVDPDSLVLAINPLDVLWYSKRQEEGLIRGVNDDIVRRCKNRALSLSDSST
jgi:hypothetical protein